MKTNHFLHIYIYQLWEYSTIYVYTYIYSI